MKRRHFHVTVGTRPQVGSTIIHCEMKSMLISLSSSSPLLLIFTDMHTDSVFPLKQWTICVLVCCASLLKTEEKARLTSEAGSQPTAADCEASVSGIRVTVERFEAKVIQLNTHSVRAVLTSGSLTVRHAAVALFGPEQGVFIPDFDKH